MMNSIRSKTKTSAAGSLFSNCSRKPKTAIWHADEWEDRRGANNYSNRGKTLIWLLRDKTQNGINSRDKGQGTGANTQVLFWWPLIFFIFYKCTHTIFAVTNFLLNAACYWWCRAVAMCCDVAGNPAASFLVAFCFAASADSSHTFV